MLMLVIPSDQSSRQSGRLDASPPLTDARSGPQTLSFGGPRRSDATIGNIPVYHYDYLACNKICGQISAN